MLEEVFINYSHENQKVIKNQEEINVPNGRGPRREGAGAAGVDSRGHRGHLFSLSPPDQLPPGLCQGRTSAWPLEQHGQIRGCRGSSWAQDRGVTGCHSQEWDGSGTRDRARWEAATLGSGTRLLHLQATPVHWCPSLVLTPTLVGQMPARKLSRKPRHTY